MSNGEVTVQLLREVGAFAQDKDRARELREQRILPGIESGKTVILDFAGVEGATQSFVHALISDVLRRNGPAILDRLLFKNCNAVVKTIIEIVVEYMQERPRNSG